MGGRGGTGGPKTLPAGCPVTGITMIIELIPWVHVVHGAGLPEVAGLLTQRRPERNRRALIYGAE